MSDFISADAIRTMFSRAMSDMYRSEVPQYGTLLELVAEVNADVLNADVELREHLEAADELDRLSVERHGAIRLGTAQELGTMRRLFAVMGMVPVGYYDLAGAGVPVHSTAFRPIDDAQLRRNPFRVFTSLLRLDLIEDDGLRHQAAAILARRDIFSPGAIALIERFESEGGLTSDEARTFVREALETFRWHREASVDKDTYDRLHSAHRLIADVVSFKGPHINHLTPRTLDIDEVQRRMPLKGIVPKAVIEGPPRRACDILLRQTSFKAIEEPIAFQRAGEIGPGASTHAARFGEIEQRGIALTPKGRKLYDKLLGDALGQGQGDYSASLHAAFAGFPDDWNVLRTQNLGYFRYSITEGGRRASQGGLAMRNVETLVQHGFVAFSPIVYEDFLPVSAAGIFQSNLGSETKQAYESQANRQSFEQALGMPVHDEFEVYAAAERASLRDVLSSFAGEEAVAGTPVA